MDELFLIERYIGDVKAIIGLQFVYEPETIDVKDIEYEEFPEAAVA